MLSGVLGFTGGRAIVEMKGVLPQLMGFQGEGFVCLVVILA